MATRTIPSGWWLAHRVRRIRLRAFLASLDRDLFALRAGRAHNTLIGSAPVRDDCRDYQSVCSFQVRLDGSRGYVLPPPLAGRCAYVLPEHTGEVSAGGKAELMRDLSNCGLMFA